MFDEYVYNPKNGFMTDTGCSYNLIDFINWLNNIIIKNNNEKVTIIENNATKISNFHVDYINHLYF